MLRVRGDVLPDCGRSVPDLAVWRAKQRASVVRTGRVELPWVAPLDPKGDKSFISNDLSCCFVLVSACKIVRGVTWWCAVLTP